MTSSQISIASTEVMFEAVRSRGPGGQNVNKVSSAAILRWSLLETQAFSEEEKIGLRLKLKYFLNQEDILIIRSDEFRDLPRNKERSLEKFKSILSKALFKPKKRIPTRPTRASRTKNQKSKQQRSETKKQRRRVTGYE